MKKVILAAFLLLSASLLSLTAFAGNVCKYSIAKVTCGAGTVDSLFAAGWAILNGTTVTNTLALMGGADILRVHDVKEAVEVIKIFCEIKATIKK